ncbi:DUF4912 domain-containing protein [Thermosipho atlanticus]|uniref:DUF4912 domain-containing protein n=1 Tax=Thermosipho atlanticus DSM 15807 TaxID=1123380 RepID=A0A1M5T7Y6_9BACT|nr:DUF4912 domain-containing protein [Thermosipho atlanticus]SHH46473.1 hypothetical protein SAMN02745199_1201 [Thermosipho atlanticus DSM 15807]
MANDGKSASLKNWLKSNPTIQELKSKAKKLGLKVKRMMKKREVVKLFEDYIKKLEKFEEIELNNKSSSSSSSPSKPSKDIQRTPQETTSEIPQTYNKDKLVLMPVNPNWIHVYWDFSESTRNILKNLPNGTRTVLRIYDVTFINFKGNNAHRTFEILIDINNQKNYYFNVPMPNADYMSELGYLTRDGRFVPILRSNVCRTPSNSPSQSTRERWLDIRKKRKIVNPSDGPVIKEVERVASSIFGLEREISKTLSGKSFNWQLISVFRSGRGI